MPWVCTTRSFPWVILAARAGPSGLPAVAHHRGIGRRFRRHLVKRWGVSHGAASTAWTTLTTCVWIGTLGGAGAAGGAAWLAWPFGGGGALGGALPLSGAPDVAGQVVAVPEPSTLWVLLVAVAAIAVLNEWRRAKRRAARVTRFTGWPPPKPPLISTDGDGIGSFGALLAGAVFGAVFWALLLIPAWLWGIL